MTTHTLKTEAPYFDAVERGEKTFEVRRDDRGFQRGDKVILERMHDESSWNLDSSADPQIFTVGWILTGGQFGIEPGYVVFSLEPAKQDQQKGG